MRLLDAGCGTGEALEWLHEQVAPEGIVVGIDLASAHTDLVPSRNDFPRHLGKTSATVPVRRRLPRTELPCLLALYDSAGTGEYGWPKR
jgi:SAM-dependent methyltransferase